MVERRCLRISGTWGPTSYVHSLKDSNRGRKFQKFSMGDAGEVTRLENRGNCGLRQGFEPVRSGAIQDPLSPACAVCLHSYSDSLPLLDIKYLLYYVLERFF